MLTYVDKVNLCSKYNGSIEFVNSIEAAVLAKQGWQPIESAPKSFYPPISPINHHSPQILGLWGKAFYCVCQWGGPSAPWWVDSNNRKIPFQPTHWMPLPAAPKEQP